MTRASYLPSWVVVVKCMLTPGHLHIKWTSQVETTLKMQMAVTAYLKRQQLLLYAFALKGDRQ